SEAEGRRSGGGERDQCAGQGGGAQGEQREARPRIRVGAVLYGLVLAAASIGLLVVSADPVLRAQVVERGITLEPGAALALAVAALGAMALLLALARLLDRRAARDDG
ncbi:hypothetical protein, partial [Rathayibacter sp. AY1H3]|uniref:hypothetical protein n=1 Tax=Rathayibacter sp. AY1H3 TaxID=2080567 RepID=UPI000D4CAEBD